MEAEASTVGPPSQPAVLASAAAQPPVLYQDDDFTYLPPAGFAYVDIPLPLAERGPQPERSPMRSRFVAPLNAQEALGGQAAAPSAPPTEASVTVIVRSAQGLGKVSLLQVGDISAYGTPEEAAKLLVPRGSTLLGASAEVQQLPPRDTPLGALEVPPRSYYLYEYETPRGEHIAMVAAAARGKVYVCGGATPRTLWPQYSQQLVASVKSFRIKDLAPK